MSYTWRGKDVYHCSRFLPWLWVPKGTYRNLICGDATKHVIPVWREILGMVLERRSLEIEEEPIMGKLSKGYLCRKCMRAFEAFQTTKEKLMRSAEAALMYIPSKTESRRQCTSQSRRRLLKEDYAHELVIPTNRPRITLNPPHIDSSPVFR